MTSEWSEQYTYLVCKLFLKSLIPDFLLVCQRDDLEKLAKWEQTSQKL